MKAILQSIKTNVADVTAITDLVGTKCSLAIELQNATAPFIAYNLQELQEKDKDGTRDYQVTFALVHTKLSSLIDLYEALKTTVETNLGQAIFQGSDFLDITDKDDHFIVALTFNINI